MVSNRVLALSVPWLDACKIFCALTADYSIIMQLH